MKRQPLNLTKEECSNISERFALSYDEVLQMENFVAYKLDMNAVKPLNSEIIAIIENAINRGVQMGLSPYDGLQGMFL